MSNPSSLKSILLVAANPKSTTSLRLQEEEREIKMRLRLSGYGKVPINSVVATRPRDIQQALLDFKPQIVHFSGHGASQQGLIFEDETGKAKFVESDALAQLFKLFSDRIECIVLNACYSMIQAQEIARYINYVVGMNEAIGDSAAIEFSVGFYAALGAGENFEFAHSMGCVSIRLAGIQEYLIPELFKREIPASGKITQSSVQKESSSYYQDCAERNLIVNDFACKTCSLCGYDNLLESNLCDICGCELINGQPSCQDDSNTNSSSLENVASKVCLSCGYKNLLDSDFCDICGCEFIGSQPSLLSTPTSVNKDNFEPLSSESSSVGKRRVTRPAFDIGSSGEIRIIGPRNSGKTTFLAALADWHDPGFRKPLKAVEPINEDASELKRYAVDILRNGERLSSTDLGWGNPDPYALPHYLFLLHVTPNFWHNPLCWLLKRNVRFTLSCKDFAGEFIHALNIPYESDYIDSFIDDCAFSSGLLVMIDATDSPQLDKEYSQAFSTLRRELTSRIRRGGRKVKYRIAVVFSKADQHQIWSYRGRLNKFVNANFPCTQNVFQEWSKDGYCAVTYFACSAFGMMGKPPQPNVIDNFSNGNCGCLLDPLNWQPFGLASAVYWLSTGKIDSRLQ